MKILVVAIVIRQVHLRKGVKVDQKIKEKKNELYELKIIINIMSNKKKNISKNDDGFDDAGCFCGWIKKKNSKNVNIE